MNRAAPDLRPVFFRKSRNSCFPLYRPGTRKSQLDLKGDVLVSSRNFFAIFTSLFSWCSSLNVNVSRSYTRYTGAMSSVLSGFSLSCLFVSREKSFSMKCWARLSHDCFMPTVATCRADKVVGGQFIVYKSLVHFIETVNVIEKGF